MDYSIIIKNGLVVDGSGNPWFKADVGIREDRIARIGRTPSSCADLTINAEGLVVSPGFIDIHSHSDLSLLVNPRAESKIMQGVTTEVNGNCGNSAAPLGRENISLLKEHLSLSSEVNWDWSSFGEYLDRLEKQGTAVNVATLVGHGTVRVAVMGYERRKPTRDELDQMKALVARSMEEGAFGISTGLIYSPGYYSTTDELVELCKVAAERGGFYATHIRSESDGLIEATQEAISVAEQAKIPLQLSHHSCKYPCSLVGGNKKTMEMLDEAREQGVDVTCDLHGYDRVSTHLTVLVPPWAFEGGGQKLIERIKDPETRRLIKKQMAGLVPVEWPRAGSSCLMRDGHYDKVYLADCKKNKHLCGKSMSDIATIRGVDPLEVVLDLLLEEGETTPSITAEAYSHENNSIVLSHSTSMVASDGSAYAPHGEMGNVLIHPRSYGCFPNIFAQYVREKKLLVLESAIRKMTSLPAQRLGLRDRGLLRTGMWADVVVFDPRSIESMATYEDPHQYPKGIDYVLVNGQLAVGKGDPTETLAGKILRHNMK